jgi:hypothetical protein
MQRRSRSPRCSRLEGLLVVGPVVLALVLVSVVIPQETVVTEAGT